MAAIKEPTVTTFFLDRTEQAVPQGGAVVVSHGVRDIQVRFKSSIETASSARLRYKLVGFDNDWRELPGHMRATLTFYDKLGAVIAAASAQMSGMSPGWSAMLEDSEFSDRALEALSPIRAHTAQVEFVSGGAESTLGIYAFKNIWAEVIAEDGSVRRLSFPVDTSANEADASTMPPLWRRSGTEPQMAATMRPSGRADSEVMFLEDNSVQTYASWRLGSESRILLSPREKVRINWKEAYSIGAGGAGVADYRFLRPGEYVLGRGLGNDLCVVSNTVSRKHARLTVNFSNLFLEDLGSFNGTVVNGGVIHGKTQIWHGQQILLGSVSVELRKIRTSLEAGGSLAPAQEAVLDSLPEDVTFQHNGYKIGQLIGRGGMGAVLQAEDASIRRQVAMKVVLRGDSPTDVLRFIHEARITGRLEHPNIVPVHTLGADEHGQPFYTMKLVRGSTLKQILNGLARGEEEAIRNYPLQALLSLFSKVCDALRFSHSQKVIHRDLKPDNIMTGDYGEVLVMDWGLAKSLDPNTRALLAEEGLLEGVQPEEEGSGEAFDSFAALNTHAGAILGTPQYMPPEQAEGRLESVDERADIYSLGAILYHILTLRPPVETGTKEQMLGQVIRGEIKTPSHAVQEETRSLSLDAVEMDANNPEAPIEMEVPLGHLPHLPAGRIPKSLEAIVLKAMTREPEGRYATVEEFQKDITAFRSGFATKAEHAGFLKRLLLLLKRHKGAAMASMVILIVSACFAIGLAREASRSKAALVRLRNAAPTFIERAWSYLGEGRLEAALDKVAFAAEVDPDNADTQLLRARLLQGLSKTQEALEGFNAVLKLRKDPMAEENVEVCNRLLLAAKGTGELPLVARVDLMHALLRQGRKPDASILIKTTKAGAAENQTLLNSRLSRLPGWEPRRLQSTPEGTFQVDLSGLVLESLADLEGTPVSDLKLNDCASWLKATTLESLQKMPLRSLSLSGCNLKDLSFLKDLNLENLILSRNPCAELGALARLPLRKLNLRDTAAEDLSPLAVCWHLEEVILSKKTRVFEPLRSLGNLKRVSRRELPNGTPDLSAPDFWKEVQKEETRGSAK